MIRRLSVTRFARLLPVLATAVVLAVTAAPWALGFSASHAAVAGHIAFAMGVAPIAVLVIALPPAAVATATAGGWLIASPWALGYASAGPVAWGADVAAGLTLIVLGRLALHVSGPVLALAAPAGETAIVTALTWRSRTTVLAEPEHVTEALTDPEACARWSPIPFTVDDDGCDRLQAGTICGVSGRLLGAPIRFRLHTLEADTRRVRLHAHGPIDIRVIYSLRPVARGCHVDACVSLHPRSGRFGRLIGRATGLLLTDGTLDVALKRIAREAERSAQIGARRPRR